MRKSAADMHVCNWCKRLQLMRTSAAYMYVCTGHFQWLDIILQNAESASQSSAGYMSSLISWYGGASHIATTEDDQISSSGASSLRSVSHRCPYMESPFTSLYRLSFPFVGCLTIASVECSSCLLQSCGQWRFYQSSLYRLRWLQWS